MSIETETTSSIGADESDEVKEIIQHLKLVQHTEAGYFRETFRSGAEPMASKGITDAGGRSVCTKTNATGQLVACGATEDQRNLCTSIYYLLTQCHPAEFWHKLEGHDIVRYHHAGGSSAVYNITPDGTLTVRRLGINFKKGDTPQVVTPGNCWEALVLIEGAWALQGEAMSPGFDYRDFVMATSNLAEQFPEHREIVLKYLKPER